MILEDRVWPVTDIKLPSVNINNNYSGANNDNNNGANDIKINEKYLRISSNDDEEDGKSLRSNGRRLRENLLMGCCPCVSFRSKRVSDSGEISTTHTTPLAHNGFNGNAKIMAYEIK